MALPQPKPKAAGRYEQLQKARAPANGLGSPPPSLNARTALAAIPDPLDGELILATVNRRVDLLEDERAHGRISEAAYREGRLLQRVFELRNRIGPASAGGGSHLTGDQKASGMHERLADLMDRAGFANETNPKKSSGHLGWVQQQLGMIDYRLVRRLLGERKSYAECAALEGKSGERGVSYVAHRCRDALEALADAKSAKGAGRRHG